MGGLCDLIFHSADRFAQNSSLEWDKSRCSYEALAREVEAFSGGLISLGLCKYDRVGIFLPKRPETVVSMFGTAHAGCVFVPINPLLRSSQVGHILRDCNARVLITSPDRAAELREVISQLPELTHIVEVGRGATPAKIEEIAYHPWETLMVSFGDRPRHRTIDSDGVALFYTSGSTGKPKGVVLSHANMTVGAVSVSQYLENTSEDRLLAVLPLSFDYGFSQLSTAFNVGASVTLMEYLLPQDIPLRVASARISGLAGVPPLWNKLAEIEWPQEAQDSLRYFTNSGGRMPLETLQRLRKALPRTQPFLMYGLTEAFRSTYLPPSEIDRRPDSIGKAIPNAEILVLRPDGTPCGANEPGELVHRGALVSLGYWNDPNMTATRFRPVEFPRWSPGLPEMAVWSGDLVRQDQEGYFYFLGRRDEMIKTSGYRVSPTEVEEGLYATELISEAVAFGVPDSKIGDIIVAVVVAAPGIVANTTQLIEACRRHLPLYMVPSVVEWRMELPRNPNGKHDRTALRQTFLSVNRSTDLTS